MDKLYRIIAWVKQLCVNLKDIVNNRKETILLKPFLKTSELRQRENDWIQVKTFEDNKLKDLKRQLTVSVDNENLLRCEWGIQHVLLP